MTLVVAASSCSGGDATTYRDDQGDVLSSRSGVDPNGKSHDLSGLASWYGPGFQGRPTASGEKFDTREFTAAHKTLPFGTMVRVIDTDTEKFVIVRINDRGPFKSGRVIDLSEAAAEDLDMKERGIIPVQLVILEWGN